MSSQALLVLHSTGEQEHQSVEDYTCRMFEIKTSFHDELSHSICVYFHMLGSAVLVINIAGAITSLCFPLPPHAAKL